MNDWKEFIENEEKKPYMKELKKFVYDRYENGTVYPPRNNVYRAFVLTEYKDTNVVILGQDPYHGPNQAHGLSFSVADSSAKFPPSLRNIFQELKNDTGIIRTNSNLSDWARQGVLLLNAVLTVDGGNAGSHRDKGWETFTTEVIKYLNEKDDQIIFVLWGADAQRKIPLITNPKHKIIKSPHPSPLSAHRGFFGSKPFSQINEYLKDSGKPEIKW